MFAGETEMTWVSLLAVLALAPGSPAAGPLALKDGDRVALLGSALVEQEQFHGYLETRLTRRFPAASLTFRNLGWSGDTVQGVARTAGLGNPEGLERLLKEVRALKPTVLFLGYGSNESFAGAAGLPGFLEGYNHLLDRLAPLKARAILLSPAFHEDLGRPFPDPAAHNRDLEQYTAALRKLAARRRLLFVDLFHPLLREKRKEPRRRLSTNGLLPSKAGYRLLAAEVERQLLGPAPPWEVELDHSGKVLAVQGARVAGVSADGKGLRFEIQPALLPPPDGEGRGPFLRIRGLGPGNHVLRIGGREVRAGPAALWERGVRLEPDPGQGQAERLRAAVVIKGELFSRRWRPFNDFAEHWGYIGGDARQYDAQVAAQEAAIARLRRPAPLRCEIVTRAKE
jgi:lysophospholipase L1-like esterase